MRLFFQKADERAGPWQGNVKVVNPEEQQQAVAAAGPRGDLSTRMLVSTSCVSTEQDRSIGVDDFPEIVGRGRFRQAKHLLFVAKC
jgi:hypothetical protein